MFLEYRRRAFAPVAGVRHDEIVAIAREQRMLRHETGNASNEDAVIRDGPGFSPLFQKAADHIVPAGMGSPHHEDVESARTGARAKRQGVQRTALADWLIQGRKFGGRGEAQRFRIAPLTKRRSCEGLLAIALDY